MLSVMTHGAGSAFDSEVIGFAGSRRPDYLGGQELQPPRSPRAFHRQPFPRNGQSWDSRCRFFRCEDTSPKPFRHTVYLQRSQDRSFCLQNYYQIFSNEVLHLRTTAFRPVRLPRQYRFYRGVVVFRKNAPAYRPLISSNPPGRQSSISRFQETQPG